MKKRNVTIGLSMINMTLLRVAGITSMRSWILLLVRGMLEKVLYTNRSTVV